MAGGAVFSAAGAEKTLRLLSSGVYAEGPEAGTEGDPVMRIPLPRLLEETHVLAPAPCRLFGFVFDGPAEAYRVHIRHPPGAGGGQGDEDVFDLPPLAGPRFVGFRFERAADERPGVWEFRLEGAGEALLVERFEVLPPASPPPGREDPLPCPAPPVSLGPPGEAGWG